MPGRRVRAAGSFSVIEEGLGGTMGGGAIFWPPGYHGVGRIQARSFVPSVLAPFSGEENLSTHLLPHESQ